MLNNSEVIKLIDLVSDLGKEVEGIKKKDFNYELKSDGSPLSEADKFVNQELGKWIMKTNYRNIISEENKQVQYSDRKKWEYFWMVDPIDGTKEFVKKGDDYTINIALCKNSKPIFGLVSAPARNDIYHASIGKGAFKNNKKLAPNVTQLETINIVASKSHLNSETSNFINKIQRDNKVNIVNVGSSLKICYLAEGKADLYPRFGPTMEWDTCAAHVVLNESGGKILSDAGIKLKYNKANLLNPYFTAFSKSYLEHEKNNKD